MNSEIPSNSKILDKISTSSITEVKKKNVLFFPKNTDYLLSWNLPAWTPRQLGPGVDLQSEFLIVCKVYYQKTISSSILMRTNLLFFWKPLTSIVIEKIQEKKP